MTVRARWAELRTALTGIDPGLARLRFAGVAVTAMAVAVGVMTAVRVLADQPVTVVLISGVLAMISNVAVNEPELGRLRLTTALMLGPAVVAVAGGTLLVTHRVVADIVFVAIMAVAVWARRFGPRGNALGMAAVMGYFFTQFLAATVEQLPWLLVAAAVGISSTLLLRGYLLAENPDRFLRRLGAAFGAHVHGLVEAVVELIEADPDQRAHALRILGRRRTRLNETALLVADQLEQIRADHGAGSGSAPDGHAGPAAVPLAGARGTGHRDDSDIVPGFGRDELWIIDAELSAERLSVAARRLVDEGQPPEEARRSLVAGLRSLGAATATGVPDGLVPTLLDGARRSVAALVAETDGPATAPSGSRSPSPASPTRSTRPPRTATWRVRGPSRPAPRHRREGRSPTGWAPRADAGRVDRTCTPARPFRWRRPPGPRSWWASSSRRPAGTGR